MADKKWRVRKTGVFEQDVERLSGEIDRLDEFVEISEEVLAKDPTLGKPTATRWLRGLPMATRPGEPLIVLYYAHTNEEVLFCFMGKDGDARIDAVIM